jgi:hypothetical protein
MRSCLQNCKPGDLLYCEGADGSPIIYIATKVTPDRVDVNDAIYSRPSGYFFRGNQNLIIKIAKKNGR